MPLTPGCPGLPVSLGTVVWSGLLAVVAGVLLVGGVAKLRAPAATTPMLSALGLPARAVLARGLGAVEVAVGAGAFLVGGLWFAGATAALFAAFTVSVLRLRALDGAVSCGCFGASSAPPTLIHVVVDAVAATVAAIAAVTSADGFLTIRTDLPAGGVPYLLLVGVAVALVVAVFTALPDTLVAARRTPASSAGGTRPTRLFSVEAPLS